MADKIPVFLTCPRCGEKGFDRLRTHAYCVECNYSPDFEPRPDDVPEWALKYVNQTRKQFADALKSHPEQEAPGCIPTAPDIHEPGDGDEPCSP